MSQSQEYRPPVASSQLVKPDQQPPVTPIGLLKEKSPEVATELQQLVHNFEAGLAGELLNASQPNQTALLNILRDLGNGTFARSLSENKNDPGRIAVALGGAEALLRPEADDLGKARAMSLIIELYRRYVSQNVPQDIIDGLKKAAGKIVPAQSTKQTENPQLQDK